MARRLIFGVAFLTVLAAYPTSQSWAACALGTCISGAPPPQSNGGGYRGGGGNSGPSQEDTYERRQREARDALYNQLSETENTARADKDWQKALSIALQRQKLIDGPNVRASIIWTRGLIAWDAGDHHAALSFFHAAMKITQQFDWSAVKDYEARVAAEDKQAAVAAKAQQLASDGLALLAAGNPAGAVVKLENAHNLMPGDSAITAQWLRATGEVDVKEGDLNAAIANMNNARTNNPQDKVAEGRWGQLMALRNQAAGGIGQAYTDAVLRLKDADAISQTEQPPPALPFKEADLKDAVAGNAPAPATPTGTPFFGTSPTPSNPGLVDVAPVTPGTDKPLDQLRQMTGTSQQGVAARIPEEASTQAGTTVINGGGTPVPLPNVGTPRVEKPDPPALAAALAKDPAYQKLGEDRAKAQKNADDAQKQFNILAAQQKTAPNKTESDKIQIQIADVTQKLNTAKSAVQTDDIKRNDIKTTYVEKITILPAPGAKQSAAVVPPRGATAKGSN